MSARKSIEIGQRIDKLTQKLNPNALRKAKRPSPKSFLNKLNTLEYKVAASPYATILASPLRSCGYHRRMFPSRMLLRLGMVQDPDNNKILPLPEVGHTKPSGPNGIKRYVRLQRSVLDELSQKNTRGIFHGKTEFQKDTMKIIYHELSLHAQKLYDKSYIKDLYSLEQDLWQSSSNDMYQCILITSTDEKVPFYQHQHRVTNKDGAVTVVPCYNIARLWDIHDINSNSDIAYGVLKSPLTVELAVALYRCRGFF